MHDRLLLLAAILARWWHPMASNIALDLNRPRIDRGGAMLVRQESTMVTAKLLRSVLSLRRVTFWQLLLYCQTCAKPVLSHITLCSCLHTRWLQFENTDVKVSGTTKLPCFKNHLVLGKIICYLFLFGQGIPNQLPTHRQVCLRLVRFLELLLNILDGLHANQNCNQS